MNSFDYSTFWLDVKLRSSSIITDRTTTKYRFWDCASQHKSKVGAAAARGMAMRALSCTKDGRRRIRSPSPNEFPQYLQQDLHILGGPGISYAAVIASGA